MPKRRYERRELTHEWSQIRPHLKDAAQIKYELIRPVVLFGMSAKERVLKLFYCYAHQDKPLRDELDLHLGSFKRRQFLVTWHD